MHALTLAPPLRTRPARLRILACSLLLTFTTTSVAVAAPPGDAAGPSDAEMMFRRGQAKYETADYNGAIELWTEAYALVGSIPDNAAIQALLIYNLAQAHIKAFEIDEDPIHLKQAEQLLRAFQANLETVYDDPEQIAAEQAKIDEALAEIAARTAELEPDEPEPQPDEDPERPEPEPDPIVGPPLKPGKPLLIAGGVVAGVGVAVGALAIVGAIQANNANFIDDLDPLDYSAREERFNQGYTANSLILVGSIGAGVLVTTGVALIAVGVVRNKKAQQANTRATLLPSFGPAGAGLTLSGQF